MEKFILFFLITLIACTSIKNKVINLNNEIKLSQFTIDEKEYNHLIVDREPIYGNGMKDDCIVETQISLALLLSEKNTLETKYKGKVTDSETNKPLPFVIIQIFRKDTLEDLRSDENGEFKLITKEDIQKIKIKFIGCRELVINFSKSNKLL